MNGFVTPTPPLTTGTVRDGATSRARSRLADVGQAIADRFRRATAAFRDRLAWERTALPWSAASPPPKRRRLAGFLFPLEGGAPEPLYEGTLPVGDEVLRVENDFVRTMASDGGGPGERVQTNETLTVGARRFHVKLLDELCRVEVVELIESGEAR